MLISLLPFAKAPFLNRCGFSVLLCLTLASQLWASPQAGSSSDHDSFIRLAQLAPSPTIKTSTLRAPAKDDNQIAQTLAQLLARNHYSQKAFDDEVSAIFLQEYIETLDPQHILFLQDDILEFSQLKSQLDDLTIKGDISPGFTIYTRFLQRLRERTEYVTRLLAAEDFAYDIEDCFTYDRSESPRPADAYSAQALWRARARYEVLNSILTDKKIDEARIPGSKKFSEIENLISKRYERTLKAAIESDNEAIRQLYLSSLCHAFDPHSEYLGPSELEQFSIQMSLSLFGIGAVLESKDGCCLIKELVKGGPAARSGNLKPGDKIIGVAQDEGEMEDVVDMPLNKVVRKIRGKKGTIVRLLVIPTDTDDSLHKTVKIVRDQVKLEDQEAKGRIYDLPLDGNGATRRLGVVELPSFYANVERDAPAKSTTVDCARLIAKLKMSGVEGIILDLRLNGGGFLDEAIRLAGLFISQGPVVQVRDNRGEITVQSDTDPDIFYDGPLVVMTNHFSASASEIVAAALQDYGRAVIVGDKSTHGKGTVQTLVKLDEFISRFGFNFIAKPGAMKITVQKFYRADGRSTQLKGVQPDVILPSLYDALKAGEGSLDHPLPWDEIQRAPYEKINRVQWMTPHLKAFSDKRIASDLEFGFVREDIARRTKEEQDKTISLNLDERLSEIKTNKSRKANRESQRLQHHLSDLPYREITLRDIDKPTLPEPITGDAKEEEKNDSEEEDSSGLAGAYTYFQKTTLREGLSILSDMIDLAKQDRSSSPTPR